MKRLLKVLALIVGVGSIVQAGTSVTYDGPMTDSNAGLGVASSTTGYRINLDDKNIDYASVQILTSSGNYASSTFSDGRASAFTMTVVNPTALSTAAATGQLTMVSVTAAAGAVSLGTVVISSNVLGAQIHVTGPPGNQDYTVGANVAQGSGPTVMAVNLRDTINLSSSSTGIMAQVNTSSTVLTISAISSGTFGNSWSVTSTSSTAISSAAFAGGINPVTVTIGGYKYVAGSDFTIGASTAAMAQNLSQVIYNSSATTLVTSTASFPCTIANGCGVVYATATVAGLAGNYALASSNALAISTSGATMTGGLDNAVFCINGTCLTANTHWYPKATVVGTAQSIYAAINSSFTIVTSTERAGVVYTTASAVGVVGNYATFSSSSTALLLSPLVSSSAVTAVSTGIMYGGSASSYTLTGTTIKIPAHGYPTGLMVSISSTTGNKALYYSSAVVGTANLLTMGSTWYVIPVDANTISLALTSTGAVAGTSVYMASSQTVTTPDVWTVYIATPVGGSSYGWFQSNNATDWIQVGSTYTYTNGSSFVYPSSMTYVDFGNIDYKWLQLNVAPPATSGGMVVKTYLHGEKR
jgi:hypothetical protein